jgi:long-chain fatty acid transport protein
MTVGQRLYAQSHYVLSVCFILCLTAAASAITDEEIFRNFQFSFVTPGARSTAMGVAFIGLADDATAVEANPAGLVILTKPEVSLEYRNITVDSDSLNSTLVFRDERRQLLITADNRIDSQNRPSFLSVVYPVHGWTLGFSRQEITRFHANLVETFELSSEIIPNANATTSGSASQDITNYNFSIARKLGKTVSVGGTFRYSHLDWKTDVLTDLQREGQPSILAEHSIIRGSDNAPAFNIGVLFRANEHFSFGAVYKRNPKFEVPETLRSDLLPQISHDFKNVLKVPDVYGFGASVKPNDNITVSADVLRIEYADLLEKFESGISVFTIGFNNQNLTFRIENSFEFHIGAEFVVFLKKVPIALRQGYYRKPTYSLILDTTSGLPSVTEQTARATFSKRKNENHITLGSGFVLHPNFQIDWGVDLSNLEDDFVLSTVVRF